MRRTLSLSLAVVVALAIGLALGLWLGGARHNTSTARQSNRLSPHGTTMSQAAAAKPKRKVLYWWDPMVGPASISPKPGISSMGMALIPVYAPASGASIPGEVRVGPAMVQDMGIQTQEVTIGALSRLVRTVGYLRVPAPQRYSVTIRTGGWIGKLYATTNGAMIRKGQKLFTLYSPSIVAAENELIAAQQSLLAARKTGNVGVIRDTRGLRTSVEMRLDYLGVSKSQVKEIEHSARPITFVHFYSPAAGYLVDVKVQQKSRIDAGVTALRIENLKSLWLDTYIYENQIPWVHIGQSVTARIAAFPGQTFTGKIIFIDPFENPISHTVAVRVVLDNASHDLRPGMYALANIRTQPAQHAILAPRSAIINTGTGELAFVEISRGHFDPVTVKTGLNGEHGTVQILSGLGPSQKVVTSGQFMIDVESQLNQVKARFMPKLSKGKPTAPAHAPKPNGPQTVTPPATTKPATTMPKGMKM